MKVFTERSVPLKTSGSKIIYVPYAGSKIIAEMHPSGTVAKIKCNRCGGELIMHSARVTFTEANMTAYLNKFGNCWRIRDGKTYPNCVGFNPDKHCKHCGCEFIAVPQEE